MAPAIVPLIQNIGIYIQRAKNKHQIRSIVYFFIAIFNAFISIYFAIWWGEIGCAIGTAIAITLGPILFMNFYYQKKLHIDILNFWFQIVKTIPGFLLPVAGGILLMCFYSFHSLADFALFIFIYSVIYILSIFFLSFNNEEKQYIINLFNKIFFRKRRIKK